MLISNDTNIFELEVHGSITRLQLTESKRISS